MTKEHQHTTSDNYPNPLTPEELSAVLTKGTKNKPPAAEDIANVVADIRKGHSLQLHPDKQLSTMALGAFRETKTIVDATWIYEDLINESRLGKAVAFYEDHPSIAPPWEQAIIGYQNDHGNIVLMHCTSSETDGTEQWPVDKRIKGELVEDEPKVEWGRVKWRIDVLLWVGGQDSSGERSGTSGPLHCWRLAVYEDGEPADLSWVQLLPQYPMEYWDMAHATLLGALNFLNCKNIEIVDPVRPRAEARRIARMGVTVSQIVVFPAGKSSRSPGAKGMPLQGTPLTTVRGHFSHYGPKYDRGLLFGKYEGKFWVPATARGSKDFGEREEQVFTLRESKK